MRHRLANLETVVAERDELRARLTRADADDAPEAASDGAGDDFSGDVDDEVLASGADAGEAGDTSSTIVPDTRSAADETSAESGEIAGFATMDAQTADTVDAVDAADAEAVSTGDDDADVNADVNADADTGPSTDPDPKRDSEPDLDLDAAASVLGARIRLDDLTVVEGIGPKISELCNGIGVTTWRQLADTDVAALRSMLDAAGSRYRVHDPGTWPQQAALLARGEWAGFKQLTDDLHGGR